MIRLLGIDYGEKRIGLALADKETGLAVPLEIVENKGSDFVFKKLNDICRNEDVKKIIVGMPVSLSGKEGKKAEEVRHFVNWLKDNVLADVETEDERLSSKMVDSLAKDKKKPKDAVSAMIILQSYLDKKV